MTDPERISKRSAGLAGELLRAASDEQPAEAAMQRTLAALGLSGAILATSSVASASLAGAQVGAAGTKAVTAALLVKWIGIGVVSGVGLAGAAAMVSAPASPAPASVVSAPPARAVTRASAPAGKPVRPFDPTPLPPPSSSAPTVAARSSAAAVALPEVETAPLAAELSLVDRARSLLGTGQPEQSLALLTGYEREFPAARLLPEVLFLQLEAFERLSRRSEARHAAERLVSAFPQSPHAARARRLLSQ